MRAGRWRSAAAERAMRRQEQAQLVAHCRAYLAKRFGLRRQQWCDCLVDVVERLAPTFGMSGNALRKMCKRYQIPVSKLATGETLTARKRSRSYSRASLRPLAAPKRKQPRRVKA
jgi:hypothetical protein